MTAARALFLLGLRQLRGGSLRIIEPRTNHHFGRAAPGDDELEANVWVHDERTYARVLGDRSVGLAESYADGWWDTDDLTSVLRIARRTADRVLPLSDRAHRAVSPVLDLLGPRHRADKTRDARNVRAHYDLGNDFFAAMLDDTMMYSSAVFEQSNEPLASASTRKMRRLATLLSLTADDHILEIGSGWGGFAENTTSCGPVSRVPG
jgi:cyclopropane-fatty-acyl-phospholipid synthase